MIEDLKLTQPGLNCSNKGVHVKLRHILANSKQKSVKAKGLLGGITHFQI